MTSGVMDFDTIWPRSMDMKSLPQYRGSADAPKLWREPDGHGKSPFMRLRDYVILALIFALVFPTTPSSLHRFWVLLQRNRILDSERDETFSGRSPRTGLMDR